jgi:DNA-binding transcriptional regulator GbsR (MarR family)
LTKRQYKQHEKPAFFSEATTKKRWPLNSEEGPIIKAIIQSGHPLTWTELQEATGLEQEPLRKALCGLFSSTNEFHKIYSYARKQYVYEISEKLFEVYREFHDLKKRFLNG